MIGWIKQNRQVSLLFATATLLHALLLLIPVARQVILEHNQGLLVKVELRRPALMEEQLPEEPAEPVNPSPLEPSQMVRQPPPKLADLPEIPPDARLEITPEPVAQAHDPRSRILSRQFEYETPESLFGPKEPMVDGKPEYYARYRPALKQVLNEPSLQLPFRDTRVYLVDSYSAGFGGSVERFFDNVTVPFGWTTKNNTRVQCAWVLVIAGCSWGHNSLFYREARKRKSNADKPF